MPKAHLQNPKAFTYFTNQRAVCKHQFIFLWKTCITEKCYIFTLSINSFKNCIFFFWKKPNFSLTQNIVILFFYITLSYDLQLIHFYENIYLISVKACIVISCNWKHQLIWSIWYFPIEFYFYFLVQPLKLGSADFQEVRGSQFGKPCSRFL